MTVDDVYKLVLYIARKNSQGNITPEDFNRNIKIAQAMWQAYMLGNFQDYQQGRPIARVELGNNRTVRQRLAPSIYGYTLGINATTGIAPYPSDFLQVDTMYSIYGVQRIRYIDSTQLDSAYNSVIDPIASNPIYTTDSLGFKFYGATWQAKLTYVRQIASMFWGYTLDANNRPVYSAAASRQPLFDDLSVMEIVARCLELVGINLQVGAVVGYAKELKMQGQ